VIPAAVLEDVERLAVGHHLALACGEGVNLLAALVIDVVPRAGCLDVADPLGLQCAHRCREQHQDDEYLPHSVVVINLDFSADDFVKLLVAGLGQNALEVGDDALQRLLGRAVAVACVLAQQLLGRGQ